MKYRLSQRLKQYMKYKSEVSIPAPRDIDAGSFCISLVQSVGPIYNQQNQ
jgi:hypothetical protein